MIHRCTLQRDASRTTTPDPYGNHELPSWQTHLSDLHCRWWFQATRTIMNGDTQQEVQVRKLVVPLDTDVTEDDRVLEVVDRRGRQLSVGPMRIDSVGDRLDHKVLTMVEVQ
jgi:hypothetical protein